MNIPEWIKNLKSRDELLLYFPYSGNYLHAEFIEHITQWTPGIHVQYVDEKNKKVKTYELRYEHYGTDASNWDHWIAYEMVKK